MAEQLFQIGVKALIINNTGKLLLVGRHGKGQADQTHLDLPGGRMDTGETVIDALKRELQEEINVSDFELGDLFDTLLSNITIPVGDTRVPLVLVIYNVQLVPNQPIELGDEEEVYEWLEPAAAAKVLKFKYPVDFCTKISSLL